jgi:hypothetical protein
VKSKSGQTFTLLRELRRLIAPLAQSRAGVTDNTIPRVLGAQNRRKPILPSLIFYCFLRHRLNVFGELDQENP